MIAGARLAARRVANVLDGLMLRLRGLEFDVGAKV